MTTPRMNGANNRDNTGAVLLHDYQNPTYAASIAITTKQNVAHTLVQITLAGNLTLTAGVGSATTDPQVGDQLKFLIKSDAAIRTVTLSTGLQPAAPTIVTVASKTVSLEFMFDGTGWQEMGRAIQA